MTAPCIHGFRTEECTSCRTCPHGLVASRCGRCIRASSTPAGRKALLVATRRAPFRGARAASRSCTSPSSADGRCARRTRSISDESYRSIFLARKAADDLASAASAKESKRSG